MTDNATTFLMTKQYRRFTEFADAVRRDRYIGLCHGPPGVGKTLSARHYAQWDGTADYLSRHRDQESFQRRPPPAGLDEVRTVFWTTPVLVTARQINNELLALCDAANTAIRQLPTAGWRPQRAGGFPHVELLVIDEADRLKTTGLDQLRDLYDRHGVGLVLIGMPGLERRLTRYPQLYSRVGFAHEYQPLARTELLELLTGHATELGLHPTISTLNDPDALAAIARITGGNFRLVQRLFAQINRVAELNDLTDITHDVVATARASLIIGTT